MFHIFFLPVKSHIFGSMFIYRILLEFLLLLIGFLINLALVLLTYSNTLNHMWWPYAKCPCWYLLLFLVVCSISSIYCGDKYIILRNDKFAFLSNCSSLIYFSFLIALVRTSKTVLNSKSESKNPCPAIACTGNAFNVSPLNIMILVGFCRIA